MVRISDSKINSLIPIQNSRFGWLEVRSLFLLLAVLGTAAVITPIEVSMKGHVAILIATGLTLLLLVLCTTDKFKLVRREGVFSSCNFRVIHGMDVLFKLTRLSLDSPLKSTAT